MVDGQTPVLQVHLMSLKAQVNKILHLCISSKEALAIRRIFSLVDMITKAKFSNSPNDFKIRLCG